MSGLLLLLLAAPFSPTLEEAELYGETYSMVFDDGTRYALLQMAISNIGPGDEKGACRWILAESQAETDGQTFDRDQWKAAAALKIGPCRLEADDKQTRMHTAIGAVTLDLEVDAAPRPVHPPHRRYEADDAFYEMELLIPSAPARLTVRRGKTKVTHTGRAFMNHSRNTALPSKIARRWVRFRALDGASPGLALVRFPPQGKVGQGWVYDGKSTSIQKARLASKSGPLFRAQLLLDRGRWTLTTQRLIFRDAPLEKYGWLGAILGRILGNPVTYTFRATMNGGRKGIMEVSVVE